MNDKVNTIEEYIKSTIKDMAAHDFNHADRVRRWAIKIALPFILIQLKLQSCLR